MKLPGSDHPIAIAHNPKRVVVRFAGRVIADTTRALTLKESTYAPVFYIPREGVDMALLERTTHESYCPYKGDANYYSVKVDGRVAENAVWTYEAAYEAVAPINALMAFYASKVDVIEERAA